MARVYKLYVTDIGGDVQTVDIYHTAVTSSNLIEANVTASRLISGSGVEITVEDDVDKFIAHVGTSGSLCYLRTGSLEPNTTVKGVRYFEVAAFGDGLVNSVNPQTLPSQSYSQSIDYRIPGQMHTIKAACTSPTTVVGFYYDEPTEANFISSGSGDAHERYLTFNSLTHLTGSVDDYIYVKFSTGSGSYGDYYYSAYNSYY
jgi:hypothetical protein